MKFDMKTTTALVMCGMLAALTACQKPEGPAEKAGK
jgi:hypothetical protein